jgi:hypothetical protein
VARSARKLALDAVEVALVKWALEGLDVGEGLRKLARVLLPERLDRCRVLQYRSVELVAVAAANTCSFNSDLLTTLDGKHSILQLKCSVRAPRAKEAHPDPEAGVLAWPQQSQVPQAKPD